MTVADKGPRTIVVTTVLTIASAIVVFLRLYVRLLVKKAAGWDDFFIFMSEIAISVSTVMVSQQVKWGFGKHMGDLSEGMQSHMFFYFWLNFVSYQASIGFTRVSIIFQYLRVFAVTKATRTTLICMLIFVALYTLQAVIVTIFSCTPVSDFWNGENPGLCIDIKAFWIFHAVFTISFDILIIYLPIPIIRRLKISRKQRVTLIILFSLGAMYVSSIFRLCTQRELTSCGGTITSLLRIIYIYTLTDKIDASWENVDATVWSSIEINVAVICASLPTFKPLVSRMLPGLSSNGHTSSIIDLGGRQRTDPQQYGLITSLSEASQAGRSYGENSRGICTTDIEMGATVDSIPNSKDGRNENQIVVTTVLSQSIRKSQISKGID